MQRLGLRSRDRLIIWRSTLLALSTRRSSCFWQPFSSKTCAAPTRSAGGVAIVTTSSLLVSPPSGHSTEYWLPLLIGSAEGQGASALPAAQLSDCDLPSTRADLYGRRRFAVRRARAAASPGRRRRPCRRHLRRCPRCSDFGRLRTREGLQSARADRQLPRARPVLHQNCPDRGAFARLLGPITVTTSPPRRLILALSGRVLPGG